MKLTALLASLNVVLITLALWQTHLLRELPKAAATAGGASGETARPRLSNSSAPPPGEAERRASGNEPASRDGAAGGAAAAPGRTGSLLTRPPGLDWRQVESGDYRAYVQNLRAIGCPEQTIRDIVSADVVQELAARRAAVLDAFYHDFKYWKADPTQTAARAQLATQRQAVDEEMTAVLHELLGADFVPPPTAYEWKVAELEQQLGFLPADKREATKSVLLQYAETDQQIRALASNQYLTENLEERRRIVAAYDNKQAQLAGLLTPAELEQVELTASWTAENLRRAMVHFEPTEEEFRGIFREWLAQDEKLARIHATAEPDPGNLQDAVFAQIRELLGEKRYHEYRSTWWK